MRKSETWKRCSISGGAPDETRGATPGEIRRVGFAVDMEDSSIEE
jgi:hypothetical protein